MARAAEPPSTALVERSTPGYPYSVRLPRTWHLANASYPSDHVTLLWYDPANALRRMSIVLSGCWGCAHSLRTGAPDPSAVLADVTSAGGEILQRHRLSADRLGYQAFTPDDPYRCDGLAIVAPRGSPAYSYADVGLWLPASERGLATAILRSFQIRL